jgi:cytochrome c553
MKTLPSLPFSGVSTSCPHAPWVVRGWAPRLAATLALLAGNVAFAANSPNIEAKVAMCIGCHGIPGYQASFPEVHKVPMISGQNARYIAAALTAYQKGERKHPTMKGVAAPLSEQDINEIAAYYEASGKDLPPRPAPGGAPSPEVQALLGKGNCAACHGEGLNKPIDGSYPKLAGQHADYLYVALKAYQTEGLPQIGRSNAIMAAQSKLFTHRELKLLSAYVASLQGDLKTVPQAKFR